MAGAVALHLFLIILASRFQTILLGTYAFYSGLGLYFVAGPILWLWHRTTLPLNKRGSLDSIIDATAEAQTLEKYDPVPYFAPEKGLFLGLDIGARLRPVYAPWGDIRSSHMQVVGTTGFGKGVATTMMLAQCVLSGETVVIFDPKFPGDQFAGRVLKKFAGEHGIPFYLINLSPEMPPPFDKHFPCTPPQLNLFAGCSESQLNELLSTAFNLSDQGGAEAHYRLHDRIACQDVCARATAVGTNITIKDLVAAANKSRKIDEEKGADFKAKLEEISRLPVLNTARGHDLKAILDQNAILYIIGTIRDPQATAIQKMLLLRIMQIIEKRDRNLKLRPVAMMLDELKYLLSPGVLQALGAVRDKGCHILLAHQTNGDLADCGGLPSIAVTAAVKINTSQKLIYRSVDNDDAEWASGLSGTIVVQQKSAHMQQGMFHAGEGQFREMERPFLTQNQLRSMPKMTGMLYGFGLAKRVQVSPMSYGEWPEITAAPPIAEQPKQQKDEAKPNDKTQPALKEEASKPEAAIVLTIPDEQTPSIVAEAIKTQELTATASEEELP